MAATTQTVIDDSIRVVLQPSQASYFAGEQFTVSITITNTRTPEAPQPPRSASHSSTIFHHQHKRGAHSISSVPLARPPTSPGLKSAFPALSNKPEKGGGAITRRGLIGVGKASGSTDGARTSKSLDNISAEGSEGSGGSRRAAVTKSLSVSIPPDEVREHIQTQEDTKGKSPLRTIRAQELRQSPTSPKISSPLARSNAVPLNHPHARKHSVLDGQIQLQDFRPPPSLSPFNPAPTPSASTSTFSLSLDPIAESNGSPLPPNTPSFPSPIPETSPTDFRTSLPNVPDVTITGATPQKSYAYPPKPTTQNGPPRRPTHLGLGHGPPPGSSRGPKSSTSSSFLTTNSELILYSYAQLVGSLSITPLPGSNPTPEQTRALHSVRTNLLKKQAIGGGSMDLTHAGGGLSPTTSTRSVSVSGRRHGRSNSLTGSVFSLLSSSTSAPTVPPTSQSWTPGHKARTPSMFSGLFSASSTSLASPGLENGSAVNGNGTGVGLGLSMDEEVIDPDVPLPTFEVQPAMLAVDLSLGPGESRSYTYTITLPENLPPTFRGRALKFSYQFILGICRAASGPPSATSGNSRSRVMKVPIRVYNHVFVGRPPSPYDLLWPVESRKQRHLQSSAKIIEQHVGGLQRQTPVSVPNGKPPEPIAEGLTYQDLQSYARTLLASTAESKARSSNGIRDPAVFHAGEDQGQGMDGVSGCREAVEILTRNPKKLSYDVNKDGVKVAVLTFTKSAYRLGEPVFGVVELNERTSRARVLKLSALLEAHESLPGCISPSNNSRHLRRVHAEHHSSFMTSTLRTTFSLDIPSDGSPAFQVDVKGASNFPAARSGNPGGLEWKVRLCLLVSVGSSTSRTDGNNVRLKNLVRDGPKGEWGSSWKATTTIAPMERPDPHATINGDGKEEPITPSTARSWMSFFTTNLLGVSEIGYHDGDEDLDEDEEETKREEGDAYGSEEEWKELKVEMVECEVPIKVWPGNTAFKATEVVFEV